ncbi:unnamed protein product [Larinioides sclopetarius]|uniref:Calcium-activated chloride channel N-terminal domain-containing protein n=1 Tax=Larinioides sclopetarius TaxID=280406 RepID=A0AAV2BMZ6_9ARAC
MILRCICWSIFLCLALWPEVKAQVTVDGQGYQNVRISFAPNVPSEDGKEIVDEIKDLLESTSNVLKKAIGIPIASATFLLPSSWPTETWKDITVTPASSEQIARKSDIRLEGTEDSPFSKQPVALQHGGCGVPGHQIILNLNFIGVFPNYPEGKLFAREWLKYRYGVFEENGFKDDPLYPAYYRIPGKSEIRITECTNSKVTYVFKQPILGEVCDMNTVSFFSYCKAYPDEKSSVNVTSSLMYFHEYLPKMEHICGKDGRPHHSTARNKQNALCNGRSIWDVIKSSEDFKKTKNQLAKPVPTSIQFSYIQESKPRFIVLLENSDNLFENGKPILFALRRFYYNLPLKSKLAIYTYNSNVSEVQSYTELLAQERADLGAIADFGSPAANICTSCGLAKAAQILLQDSEVEKGSILLITASPLDKIPVLSEKLKNSGTCLHVLRFTDKKNPADKTYDPLASSFHCFSQQSLEITLGVDYVSRVLSNSLMDHVQKFDDNFEIKTVASGNMSAQFPVTIHRDPTASLYTLWLDRALESSSIECKAGDTAVVLKPDRTGTEFTSFIFDPKDDDITCRLSSTKLPPVLTQVQLMTQEGHYFDFDIWIHDVSTDKEQLPIIIYAKIYFGEYPVKHANVTAVITSESRQEIVRMLDNGRGNPDITQYDGIYSGYFTGFLEAGNYQIIVKINDNKGEAKIGKDYKLLDFDACCGSKIFSKDHDVPSFGMERITVYTAKNKRPEDGYPPSRILDLQILTLEITDFVLTWTAPAGAVKYVIKLFESREDAVTRFETTGQELNGSSKVPKDTGEVEGLVIFLKDLDEDVTYYAAIRSRNEYNKQSEISNLAVFVAKQKVETTVTSSTPASTTVSRNTTDSGNNNPDPCKSKNKTIAIVLGVLGGIAVLCVLAFLAYYFFVKKPRRN